MIKLGQLKDIVSLLADDTNSLKPIMFGMIFLILMNALLGSVSVFFIRVRNFIAKRKAQLAKS